MTVYFDNSATTKPCEKAVEAATLAATKYWGNPSSLHFLGCEAAELLNKSRKQVADLLNCKKDNFFFTSSGTCANNTAIFGVYERLKKSGNRIVTTAFEHPSVNEPLNRLRKNGVEVIRIRPDKNGNINEDELCSAVNKDTILVSCMAVNNEVGSVIPVSSIKSAVKLSGSPAVIHTDCVQAFGKINTSPNVLNADIITVSAHKIHGFKGAGGIYLKDKNLLHPHILGGGQEKGVFSGTECMPAVAAFGAAAEDIKDIKGNYDKLCLLKEKFINAVKDNPDIVINSPENSIPYIINLSVLGLPSQPTVNFMSEKGICISAGSACKTGHRSPVLTAMGVAPEITDSAVRISLSRYTTEEEINILTEAFTECAMKYGKHKQ